MAELKSSPLTLSGLLFYVGAAACQQEIAGLYAAKITYCLGASGQ
jgi:hypothetical protein